jgi:uncharacterized membrane protein YdjX (TVP38/TMEM64 family)
MPDKASQPVAIRRFVPLVLLILAGVLFMVFGGHRYLTLAALAENRDWLCRTVAQSGAEGVIAFIVAYAILVSLSVPGATLLTITGGFLFGPWFGTAYVVIGATIGATIVFLAARAGLAGLAAHGGPLVARLAAGFREHGFNYLVAARLIPIFPFWLVNLAAGALGLPPGEYILGTFIGIIPVTLAYASLGNGVGDLIAKGRHPDLAILFEPSLLLPVLGLAALALLPVVYQRWRRPGRGAA